MFYRDKVLELTLVEQKLGEVENMCKDIRRNDMKYDEVKICVVRLGVKSATIYVLTWLETEKKVNNVSSIKTKTYIRNVLQKRNLFD